jgi:hypothetical protein
MKYASGGHIPGPSSTSDSIPAFISPGGEIIDLDQALALGLTGSAVRRLLGGGVDDDDTAAEHPG